MRKKSHYISVWMISALFLSLNANGQTVMQELKNHQKTTHFAQALENADLASRLEQQGPFTIFAPTNESFDQLLRNQQNDRELLLNHMMTGFATERSLKLMSEVPCLSGNTVKIDDGQRLSIGAHSIVQANIKAGNGVIHIIDGVIK